MDTCAPRQDADVRRAYAARTWLTQVAETLSDRHITYKGGQPSADGDTYTSHTKTQGRGAALGTRAGRPPAQLHPATRNGRAPQRPTHATDEVKPEHTDAHATDKDPRGSHGHTRDILTDTHNPQANGQQRTPTGTASHPQMHTDTHLTQIHTGVTFTDIQTHNTHQHRHVSHAQICSHTADTWRDTHITYVNTQAHNINTGT